MTQLTAESTLSTSRLAPNMMQHIPLLVLEPKNAHFTLTRAYGHAIPILNRSATSPQMDGQRTASRHIFLVTPFMTFQKIIFFNAMQLKQQREQHSRSSMMITTISMANMLVTFKECTAMHTYPAQILTTQRALPCLTISHSLRKFRIHSLPQKQLQDFITLIHRKLFSGETGA